jgi:hypothetical protein
VEEELVLTASSATLSPTQIVHDNDNDNDNCKAPASPRSDESGVAMLRKAEVDVVPATLPMEHDIVLASTLSPHNDKDLQQSPLSRSTRPRLQAKREVVADTYAAPVLSCGNISRGEDDGDTGDDRRRVVCDTYKESSGIDRALGATFGERRKATTLGTPDSEMIESSLYNVDSCIEDVSVSGHAKKSVDYPTTSVRLSLAGGIDSTTPSSREDRAVLSTLESDWLGDDHDIVPTSADAEDMRAGETVPPQSLTQGYEEGEGAECRGSEQNSLPLSPSAHVDINLDLSVDFGGHHEPGESGDRTSIRAISASPHLHRNGDTDSEKLPLPPTIASMSTISGSLASGSGGAVPMLNQLSAVDRGTEECDDVDSALYEVASDLSETQGGDEVLDAEIIVGEMETSAPRSSVPSVDQGGSREYPREVTDRRARFIPRPSSDAPSEAPFSGTCDSTHASTFNYDLGGSPALATWAQQVRFSFLLLLLSYTFVDIG